MNGMIMTAKALLYRNPHPSEEQIRSNRQPTSPLRYPYRNYACGHACRPSKALNGLMTMTLTTLTRDQLLAKSGVLLIVDQIQPPRPGQGRCAGGQAC